MVGKITYHKKTKPNLVCPTSLFGEAGKYTPKRDDMLAIGEMICRLRRMIYQVCDLDKKITASFKAVIFWWSKLNESRTRMKSPVVMKSSLHSDEIFGIASDEIKSAFP